MNCRAIVGGAMAAGAASLALAGTAIAATPRSGGPLVPATAGETLPAHGGTATSLNWSGYAVTPTSDGITAVASSFVVPSTSTLGGELVPGFAATWTGIGGYGSSDLIQAGTSETEPVAGALTGGQYYAWYELLPAGETELTSGCTGETNCAVSAGDHVTVNIANVSGNTWSIKLTDADKWTYAKTVTYTSSESSAEWILEAPTVGAQSILADVGDVSFGPTSTYTQGGTTHTIAQGNPTQLSISPSPAALPDGVGDEATPSALASDGQGFDACAYATSCPAPNS